MAIVVKDTKQQLLRCVYCHDAVRRGGLGVENCGACGVCFHGECRELFASDCPTLGCERPLDGRWHSKSSSFMSRSSLLRAMPARVKSRGSPSRSQASWWALPIYAVRLLLCLFGCTFFAGLITLMVTFCLSGFAGVLMHLPRSIGPVLASGVSLLGFCQAPFSFLYFWLGFYKTFSTRL
jgi:hypothetical protein